jgi:hypothetical protein
MTLTFQIPTVLYHYTTGAGLIGIVENKELWATRATFVNDAKEFWHAFDIAAKYLQGSLRDECPMDAGTLGAMVREISHPVDGPWFFITSFSANGDLLSQWRAYGRPGDSYSLGLSFKEMESATRKLGWSIQPCVYDEATKRRLIEHTLRLMFAAWSGTQFGYMQPIERAWQLLVNYLGPVALLLKHEAFKEEQEWRLVSPWTEPNSGKVKHRPGRRAIIPYIAFPLPADEKGSVFHSVYVGPGAPEAVRGGGGVRSLFWAQGVKLPGDIRVSPTPYLDW